MSYFYARTRPVAPQQQTFSLDDIYAQLSLINDHPPKLKAAHIFTDQGMAPTRVIMYDTVHNRRLLVVQGFRPLTDLILDYTPNWKTI